MDHPSAVVVLIGILTAGSERLEPLHPEVFRLLFQQISISCGRWIENSDRDARSMDSATLLGRRDLLDTVAASFLDQIGNVVSGDFEGDLLVAALISRPLAEQTVLSSLAVEKLLIALGHPTNEITGVGSAFGRVQFEDKCLCHDRGI